MRREDYAQRATLYAVEVATLKRPVLLAELLKSAPLVAEAPCGAGHFLDEYAANGTSVTLLDAEPEMLRIAAERARMKLVEARTTVLTFGTDRPDRQFDFITCPNAAVNYLNATLGKAIAAASLAELVCGGGRLLMQVLLQHADGTVDRCGCYDPGAPHGRWLTEWTRPDGKSGQLTRRRRQRRDGDVITVDLERRYDGRPLGRSQVILQLVELGQVAAQFAEHGLDVITVVPGHDQLSEILLRRERR